MKVAIAFLLLLSAATSTEMARTLHAGRQRVYHSPFRYAIVRNEVREDADPEFKSRQVEVLLEEKSFSVDTLKALFGLIAKRFPEPDRLDVEVYTSLEQIDTPEERQSGKVFAESINGTGKPRAEELQFRKHPHAILMRQNGNELIRYSVGRDNRQLVTVVLKGKDQVSSASER